MEATSKQEISDADRDLACLAGLVHAMPGTGTQDAAMAKFAAAIRAPLVARIEILGDMAKVAVDLGLDSTTKNIGLRALNDVMVELLEGFIDITHPPEANCSCHISPPCNDCVNHWGTRELIENARAALTKVAKPELAAAPLVIQRLPSDDTEGGEL